MLDRSFDAVLESAQYGDENAFALLWRDANPPLTRYLRVLAPPVAEDLAGEVWLGVVRRLDSFRGNEGQFRAWLCAIARRKVIDFRRAQARRPVEPLDDTVAIGLAGNDDTEKTALDRVATGEALEALATLPPDVAEVIMLRVVGGLDAATV